MPYANRDGIEIYYETHGGPGPGLVFAHGAGGNATSWWQQVPVYAQRFRVAVFDHRGFARSPCPPEQQSAAEFEGDLMAVMDAAKLDDAVIVCQSMGGWTGVRAAVHHPNRVRGVFLANTPGAVGTPQTAANREQLRDRIASAGGLVSLAISEEFARRSPTGALLYQQISAYNTVARPNINAEEVYVEPAAVRDSGVPFFVLSSDLDPLFPPDLLESVADAIGAPFECVAGAGHSTYFEKPDAFNAILDRALNEVFVA